MCTVRPDLFCTARPDEYDLLNPCFCCAEVYRTWVDCTDACKMDVIILVGLRGDSEWAEKDKCRSAFLLFFCSGVMGLWCFKLGARHALVLREEVSGWQWAAQPQFFRHTNQLQSPFVLFRG